MSILQAIVLGLVQGATEFAPVSSSGHLILVPWMFGWTLIGDPDIQKTFDVALHIGTLLGALHLLPPRRLPVRGGVVPLDRARGGCRHPDERIAWALVVGHDPGRDRRGAVRERDPGEAGRALVDRGDAGRVRASCSWSSIGRAGAIDDFDSIGPKEGLLLGTAQALALQPGVSRSGVTITAARAMGLDRESAARFSFLLSLPIIAGAGAYKAVDLAQTGLQGHAAEFVAGMVASAISGFVVIWGLLRYLKRHDFTVFLGYRVAVARRGRRS